MAAVKSLLRQILIHLLEAASVPESPSLPHWKTEAAAFQADLLDHLAPSMRARIDLAALWQRARKQAELDLAAHGQVFPVEWPEECPLTIEQLVDADFDVSSTIEALRQQLNAAQQ